MGSCNKCQRLVTKSTYGRLILISLGLGLALLLGWGPHVQAAPPEPYRVKDIWPGSDPSYPSWMTAVNGTLFFSADDGSNGRELWKSDGKTAGTMLVKDIWPGPTLSDPFNLTAVSDTLFFSAVDGSNGMELWKSDGTEAGTVMVKDIKPGSSSGLSYSSYLADVDGTLYFSADDGSNGVELWKSDGTADGTVLVKDIYTGTSGSEPSDLTAVNGTLFFVAYDGPYGSGRELWKSDGTADGTVLVKDIYPGGWPDSSYAPWSLSNVNGTLYFSADDGSNGRELWKSDGTEGGTVLVKDINPGSFESSPTEMTAMNGTFFFKANDGSSGNELWKSDGTEGGTVLVKDIAPGGLGGMAVSSSELTVMNGMLFFWAVEGFSSGSELWKSDGTTAGTVMVKNINPGGSSHPRSLTNVDGTLYFRANDGSSGEELWQSDGTEAGTVRVADINPGSGDSSPAGLTAVKGLLFFSANDGATGDELWAMPTHSQPDLEIAKAVDPITPVAPGSPITYTLSFANVGYTTTTNVVITDIVPLALTNVDVFSSGVTIVDTGYSPGYVWQVAELAAGQGGVITITGVVSPSASGTFTLTNQATITATSVLTDANPDNNTSVVHSIVGTTASYRLYLPLVLRQ